jgi:hypothetical protein
MKMRIGLAFTLFLFAVSNTHAQGTAPISFRGTVSLAPGPAAAVLPKSAARIRPSHRGHVAADVKVAAAAAGAPLALASVKAPSPKPLTVVSPDPEFFGFPGLTEFDQVTAGTGIYAGTQGALEPPDQGLCAGGGFVMEQVNLALAVYSTSGTLLAGPVPLNQFYGLAPEFSATGVFGPFLSDPKCYFDPGTQRWFATILEIDQDPATGAFGNHSSVLIAVSQSPNPIGNYFIFSVDTTDDGTNDTPNHPHCPCFGDQPLLGADANGIYISTNELSTPNTNIPGFNGTQLYALSKAALVEGKVPTVVHIDVGSIPVPPQDQATGIWFSVQPATSPILVNDEGEHSEGDENQNSGVEYFLSALQFGPAPYDNRIAVWALTNTRSLSQLTPNLKLQHVIITSEAYGFALTRPFAATQKFGPTPLRDFLDSAQNQENSFELLNANNDNMNQVVFAGGKLYSGANTSVIVEGDTLQGIAYFIVEPCLDDGVLSAEMKGQGYVAVEDEHVLFPSIGVTTKGTAIMAFTLSGPKYFPSAAYTPIDEKGQVGQVRLAAEGIGPVDGGSGYNFSTPPPSPTPGIARWGDYSAAVADSEGNIWFATEYIGQACTDPEFAEDQTCGGTRDFFANWGTFLGKLPEEK